MYVCSGRGAYSTLRVLRHGLTVIEMAVSAMAGKPQKIFTLKQQYGNNHLDKLMVVSISNNTLVLAIGDDKISEVQNSGFYNNEKTIHAGLIEN